MPTILIIDNEPITRKTLKVMFERQRYTVLEAESGEKGLEMFSKQRPEIAIVDINMPGINGIEVLKKIKALSNTSEVIMITGDERVSIAIEALKEGAFEYIQKPIQYKKLENDVKKALERQHLQNLVKSQKQRLDQVALAVIGQKAAAVIHGIKSPLTSVIKEIEECNTRLISLKQPTEQDLCAEIDLTTKNLSQCSKVLERIQTTLLELG